MRVTSSWVVDQLAVHTLARALCAQAGSSSLDWQFQSDDGSIVQSASFVESENPLNLGYYEAFLFPVETEGNRNNQALLSVLNYF